MNPDNPPHLSIVSAFHDQLSYNQIFLEMLRRYTYHPFELIVIDNASTDHSGQFFQSAGAIVLTQTRNCNYSEAMNIGTRMAKGEFICHVNNDVIVGHHWDRILIDAMEEYNLDFASPASLELMPTYTESKKAMRKWKKLGLLDIGASKENILDTWRRMYHNWDEFCSNQERNNSGKLLDGINGHTVMIRRAAWEKIGCYDERMLATDWDLYLRTKKQEEMDGDVRAPKVVMSAYVHHFMGVTARVTKCAYDCREDTIRDITKKWPIGELRKYWAFPMHLTPAPTLTTRPMAYLKYALKRVFNCYQWGDDW